MGRPVGLVTGGTRGIGLALAGRLVQRGFSVAVTYKEDRSSAERAMGYLKARASDGQRILTLQGNAGDAESVAAHHRMIGQELGPVSVLVNNAGVMPVKSFEKISVQEWDETIRSNLSGAFYWCRR